IRGSRSRKVIGRFNDQVLWEVFDRSEVSLLAIERKPSELLAKLCDVAAEQVADVYEQALSVFLLCLDPIDFEICIGKRPPEGLAQWELVVHSEIEVWLNQEYPLIRASKLKHEIVDRGAGNHDVGCPGAGCCLKHQQLVELALLDFHEDGF